MTTTETTRYWAKPGRRDDVLKTRIAASRIRLTLGLDAGEIRVRTGDEGPDVSWTLGFDTAEAQAKDFAARGASPEFVAVRAQMNDLTTQFERLVEEAVDAPQWARTAPATELSLVPSEREFESAGRQLKGYLYLPSGTGPFAAIIYNHGSGLDQGSLDVTSPGVAAVFLSWGYAVFLPHRHGYGNSPGPTWRSDVPQPEFSEDYNRNLLARLDRESDDVVAAFRFLAADPRIDPTRIAVAGSSFGGVNTLFAAAKEQKFRAAVEFAGAAMNWDRNKFLAAEMISRAQALTVPIFYAQAQNDYSIGPTIELAEAAVRTQRRFDSRVYPPLGITAWEGHLLAGRVPSVWSGDVRRFLDRWLWA